MTSPTTLVGAGAADASSKEGINRSREPFGFVVAERNGLCSCEHACWRVQVLSTDRVFLWEAAQRPDSSICRGRFGKAVCNIHMRKPVSGTPRNFPRRAIRSKRRRDCWVLKGQAVAGK